MDIVHGLSNVKQVAKRKLERHVLKSYRENDEIATKMMEEFFRENNAMHLLRPYVGPSNKPLMRIFNSLSLDEKRLITNDFDEYDFHFSKTYTDKSSLKTALKEMSFSYIADFCRNYTDSYVCLTSDFRPKILRNFPCHMCSNWKDDGDAQERVITQLEFFKTFKFAREEYNIRMGLQRLVKHGVIDENVMCSNPGACTKPADTLIVDHIENYVTMEQVLLTMLQHKSSRAMGFFFLPDGIDYKKKGSFYEGNLFFDRSTDILKNVKEPVLFYDKNKVFSECVYPWKEYKKFFETTLIVHEGKMYRYEIVNRTHGVAFYSISYDGEYFDDVNVPTYQLSHYTECYEVSSYRPAHNVFGKNFNNFVKKTAYIPSIIYAKVYEFALTLGMKDFSRKEIHERLCASFMRVQNAATGAITQFDPQLDVESVDIAADAIWTAAFLKRRQNAEVLASQKFINQKFGNTGFNFETLKNYLSICVEEQNPFSTIYKMYEAAKDKFYEDKFSEYLPSSIFHGKCAVFGGIQYMVSTKSFSDFSWFNTNFLPPWFKVYLKMKESDDDKFAKKCKLLLDLKESRDSKFDNIVKSPYFYFVERDRPIEDSIKFYTDEQVVLHDEPLLTDGAREKLLERLNLVTDAQLPTLHKVSVLTESRIATPYAEPINFHPLRPLNDAVSSLKMAVAYVSEDARPLINSKFDLYDLHYADYDGSIEADVVFNTFKRKYIPPSSFLAMPVIQSYITKCKNPPSYKNTLLAFNKRNWNVPVLEEVTNQLQRVGSTVENMFNCLCVPGWQEILEKDFDVHPIAHFFDTNAQYIAQLAPGKATRFNLDDLVSPDMWTHNEFKRHTNILKSDTKFSLTGEIQDEYTVNSTINFHTLETNAISSSIFRNIVKRLHAILRPEVCMMIEKDRKKVEDFFYKNFSKDQFSQDDSGYLSLEIDYSKFDKSQKERCAMIEMFIYTRLGLNEDFAAIWFESLEDMTTINYHDMIKAHWKWQRRTGTATTALGNTLVTMATICTVLFPNHVPNAFETPFKCAAFLGDDSLIVVNKNMHIPSEISEKLNTWYNLSAKFDIKDHLYFCSSFIVYIKGKGCKMIPDPKKRLLALTKPLDSEPSEVFRSLRDSCAAYLEDEEFINILAQGMAQRYHLEFEKCLFSCRVLTTVLSRYENYLGIYNFNVTSLYG